MSAGVEARALFRAFLREGRRFPNYNIREYIQRRAKEGFQEAASITDITAVDALLQSGRQELEVVKRQSLVYRLYGRKVKNVLELDLAFKPGVKPGDMSA
ncbi:hypothetical protein VOLCADRAFT_74585 [Volvox carteri f. nagariensis]|uniref:Complex 1 LYR protein domain-containing protein n=1 Tax=Volvox carteri f. nagariensis TaxID=3068 RepID=D8TVN4_VOLCA|nr:uncharacterized protein VOLCADRAFT_74585 [Volvox carteri f. nagariensis]EFJ48483.1 hypothetical protein VOLCADRAFT_74585 [Volvox carteri f. nagariensis]|eukprot:XP_002950282.1 hypothetical protein VOLCADRAFT_74585 [Volvox carteri f. nagariensis]